MEPSRPAGKRLRLVSRETLFQALEDALAETLEGEARSSPERERTLRNATRAFVARLKSGSKPVRALSRAEILAELDQSQSRFASAKREAEAELAALERSSTAGDHDRVDILERRVAKLRATFAKLEADYAELARRAARDPGLASGHSELQGRPSPAQRPILRQVLDVNLDLQRRREG